MMKDGLINPYDGDLTFVGHVMASLPVDVKVTKLFMLGHVFGCLEECLVIGQSRGIFLVACVFDPTPFNRSCSLPQAFLH